jgi:hypothetical protein
MKKKRQVPVALHFALFTKNISHVEKTCQSFAQPSLYEEKVASRESTSERSEPPLIVCSHVRNYSLLSCKHCEDGIIKEAPENSKRPQKKVG